MAAFPAELDVEARAEARREAHETLAMGGVIGTIGVASAVLFGAVCPVCVVATPALLGIGAYKRWRCREPIAAADEAETRPGDIATPP